MKKLPVLLVLSVFIFALSACDTSETPVPEGLSGDAGQGEVGDNGGNTDSTASPEDAGETGGSGSNNRGESNQGTRLNPLPLNRTVTFDGMDSWTDTYKIELTATEVLRGDAAWEIVKEGNRFNSAPEEGKEYILVLFRVKALESEDDEKVSISNWNFSFVSKDGVKYEDFISVSGLPKSFSDIYAGAETEGYVYDIIDIEDEPTIVFLERHNRGIWFSLGN
jgi:hypothetical protein